MGLGKTSATLHALDALLLAHGGPVLVLAPLRVAQSTWPDEIAKWPSLRHLTIVPIIGDAKARHRALKTPADIYTINYENIPWLTDFWGAAWPYRTVVADESTRLKSFRLRQSGQRAQALAKMLPKIDRFIALTGTPASNGVIDLWGHGEAHQQAIGAGAADGGDAEMKRGDMSRKSRTPRILELYASGMTPAEIARLLQCSHVNVNHTLQRHGATRGAVRILLDTLTDSNWHWLEAEARRLNITTIELARAMLVDAINEAMETTHGNRNDTEQPRRDLRGVRGDGGDRRLPEDGDPGIHPGARQGPVA